MGHGVRLAKDVARRSGGISTFSLGGSLVVARAPGGKLRAGGKDEEGLASSDANKDQALVARANSLPAVDQTCTARSES
eukprot:1545197-Pyramimonas_sp.AAC.1